MINKVFFKKYLLEFSHEQVAHRVALLNSEQESTIRWGGIEDGP